MHNIPHNSHQITTAEQCCRRFTILSVEWKTIKWNRRVSLMQARRCSIRCRASCSASRRTPNKVAGHMSTLANGQRKIISTAVDPFHYFLSTEKAAALLPSNPHCPRLYIFFGAASWQVVVAFFWKTLLRWHLLHDTRGGYSSRVHAATRCTRR